MLLDDSGRVLLQHSHDPIDRAKPPWRELPGGGIDPGETSSMAAARELYEETGIPQSLVSIGPKVWFHHVQFVFAGWPFEQDEHIHVAHLLGPAPEWRPAHLETLEQGAFLGARWWPLDELLADDLVVYPVRLKEFLPDVVAGRLPPEPIDIGDSSS